ncbi:MAG: signal peptide peptidase SppA [bacterium]|nr:signal peptide peptidase SppA [bacterium]
MTAPEVPPGVPPQQPLQAAEPVREARGVAFFVAIFLGLLLLASAGLNVFLLLLSVGSIAGSGLGATGAVDERHVAGVRGGANKVVQIAIHGAIAETSSPVLGARGGVVSTTRRLLRIAGEDPSVRGVVLDIDSPGGGVTDSDEIYAAVQRFRRDYPEKHVVALFGDMAASGGYYVAAAAERIFARPTTITGSIGVIMSNYNFAKAAAEFGVESVTIKSDRTPYKDILSPMREMTPAEREILTSIVDELFDRFVQIVDDGRPELDREQVLAVANGAIYSAGQALGNGLVDEIGDNESVLRWFEQQLEGDVEIVALRRMPTLADLFLGASAEAAATPSLDAAAGRLLSGLSGPRFLYYWEGGR